MEKVRREKMQVREKVGKSRNTVFCPVFCGSGGSKSRLAKAAGAETSGQMRNEKLHAVVADCSIHHTMSCESKKDKSYLRCLLFFRVPTRDLV